jgi:uncharacterized protein YjeT (DUF2065 family)
MSANISLVAASGGGGGGSGGVLGTLVHTFTSLLTGILHLGGGAAESIVGDTAEAIAKAILGLLGTWVSDGATWLLDQVGAVLNSTTGVDLGSSWFGARFSLMTELAATVMLPMLLFTVIQAIYRQSAAALLRAFLVNLPLAFIFTGVAVELLQIAMTVTDSMCSAFLSAAGVDTRHLLQPLGVALTGVAAGAPAFVSVMVGSLVATVSLVLWLELVVRSTAITAAALFLPLVLAGLVWPSTSHGARRLAETLTSLVLSKLVIVAIISLAAGALNGGVTGSGSIGVRMGEVVTGIALLLLATFSPFVLMRLVPAVEAGATSQLEYARQRMRQSAGTVYGTGKDVAMMLAKGTGTGEMTPSVAEPASGQSAGRTSTDTHVDPTQDDYAKQLSQLAPIGQSFNRKSSQSKSKPDHDVPGSLSDPTQEPDGNEDDG